MARRDDLLEAPISQFTVWRNTGLLLRKGNTTLGCRRGFRGSFLDADWTSKTLQFRHFFL